MSSFPSLPDVYKRQVQVDVVVWQGDDRHDQARRGAILVAEGVALQVVDHQRGGKVDVDPVGAAGGGDGAVLKAGEYVGVEVGRVHGGGHVGLGRERFLAGEAAGAVGAVDEVSVRMGVQQVVCLLYTSRCV